MQPFPWWPRPRAIAMQPEKSCGVNLIKAFFKMASCFLKRLEPCSVSQTLPPP